MKRTTWGLVVLVLLLSASWLRAEQSTPEDLAFPFVGKVKATELRVRAGPSVKHAQLAMLKYGDAVTVLEKKDDWFKIEPPASMKAFVSTKFLKTVSDNTAEVTAATLNVRAEAGTDKPQLGQVVRGTVVTVLGVNGEWTQIAPPAAIGVWVSATYIDYAQPAVGTGSGTEIPSLEGDAPAAGVGATTNIADGRDWLAEFQTIDGRYFAECEKEAAAWDFTQIAADYSLLLADTTDEHVQDLVNSRLKMIDVRLQMKEQLAAASRVETEQSQRLEEITRKYETLLDEIRRRESENQESSYDSAGWLMTVGRFMNRPSAWRLEKGGETLLYIDVPASGEYNLEDFAFAYVGVKGDIIQRNGRDVMIVREIKILKK